MITKVHKKLTIASLGLLLGLGVVAGAQVKDKGVTPPAPKVVWEIQLCDLGENSSAEYRGDGQYTYKGDQVAYRKKLQSLLNDGWEPFSAGVYNGGPYYNTEYVWLRRPKIKPS